MFHLVSNFMEMFITNLICVIPSYTILLFLQSSHLFPFSNHLDVKESCLNKLVVVNGRGDNTHPYIALSNRSPSFDQHNLLSLINCLSFSLGINCTYYAGAGFAQPEIDLWPICYKINVFVICWTTEFVVISIIISWNQFVMVSIWAYDIQLGIKEQGVWETEEISLKNILIIFT